MSAWPFSELQQQVLHKEISLLASLLVAVNNLHDNHDQQLLMLCGHKLCKVVLKLVMRSVLKYHTGSRFLAFPLSLNRL